MTLSCQFSQTLHIEEGKKKTILTGTHHHGKPGLPSTTVLATASPGILAPRRWGSLIRVGAHPRVLGIIKHCRFFWRGRMRAQGIVGRTQRSYSLRGWRPCSESKLYFTPFHPPSWHHWWDTDWITFITEILGEDETLLLPQKKETDFTEKFLWLFLATKVNLIIYI